MFSELIKNHQKEQAQRVANSDIARQEAVDSFARVTKSVVNKANDLIVRIHKNEKLIDFQCRQVLQQQQEMVRAADSWISTVDRLNNKMKELGDFECWAKALSVDIQTIAATLDYVSRQDQTNANTTSWGSAAVESDFSPAVDVVTNANEPTVDESNAGGGDIGPSSISPPPVVRQPSKKARTPPILPPRPSGNNNPPVRP